MHGRVAFSAGSHTWGAERPWRQSHHAEYRTTNSLSNLESFTSLAGPLLLFAHLFLLSSQCSHQHFKLILVFSNFSFHHYSLTSLAHPACPCIKKILWLSDFVFPNFGSCSKNFKFYIQCSSSNAFPPIARGKVSIVLFISILLCCWPHLLPTSLGHWFIFFQLFHLNPSPLAQLKCIFRYPPFLGKTKSFLKSMCHFCPQFVCIFQPSFLKKSRQSFHYFFLVFSLGYHSLASLYCCWNCSRRHQWLLHCQFGGCFQSFS